MHPDDTHHVDATSQKSFPKSFVWASNDLSHKTYHLLENEYGKYNFQNYKFYLKHIL